MMGLILNIVLNKVTFQSQKTEDDCLSWRRKNFCFFKLQVAIKTSKKQLFWQNRIVFKFYQGLRT